MKQTNEGDGWWQFIKLCTHTKQQEELNNLLNLFLTIEERKNVADRYLIIHDLLAGKKTQREIAGDRQVSIAKITRGSNGLKLIGERLRNFLIAQIK